MCISSAKQHREMILDHVICLTIFFFVPTGCYPDQRAERI